MIKSTQNQIANVSRNPFQGSKKKVLCLCSAGLLRSPTAANVLQQHFGYNTRAAGTCDDFCLIPVSEALVAWADEVVFVDEACKRYLTDEEKEFINNWHPKTVTLDIDDNFQYDDHQLKLMIMEQYMATDLT